MPVRITALVSSFLLSIVMVACAVIETQTTIDEQVNTSTPSNTSTATPTTTLIPSETSLPPTLTPTEIQTLTSTPADLSTSTPEPIALPVFEPSTCNFVYSYPASTECGYLIVPENRNKAGSPPIRIHVAIFKSTNPDPKPDPVIYVAGGGGVNQLASADFYLNAVGKEILKDRDFIMYNQRGSHLNEPSLVCPDLSNLYVTMAAQNLTNHEKADKRIEKRLECHNDLLNQGIDLTAYNTVETAADINDLRNVLGYEEINLYGTSSGTRTILTFMRNHPEGIRSVILDSVYPPQVNLYSTVALSVDRVFSLMFDECAANSECNQKYPNLEGTFFQLVDNLNENPANINLSQGPMMVSGDVFMEALYVSFYSAYDISLAPGRIEWAKQGVFTGMMPWFESLVSDSYTFMAMGFEWSMMCNEEVPFESYELGRQLSADLPYQIADYFDSYYEFTLCKSWQSGQADTVENMAVSSDIPALILTGQYDNVTPPEWSRLAAETLSNHYLYEFPGLSHGIMRSNACGLEIGLQFIDDPLAEPDSSCIDNMPGLEFK